MAGKFFTSVAINLVLKLGEYLLAPIGHQFGYVLCYKSYVEDLKNEVEELESARERVQRSVDEARYDGKRIYTDVQDWLGNVTKEAEKAQHLLERGRSAKNACFRGWIPNPVVHHPIGRKVKKTTKVIQGLHEKSQNNNFKKVYYENTPTGIVTATTSATTSVDKKEDALESRALIIEDVMKAITDDTVHVIGVYGPGGVGKSKLLEDVKRLVEREKLFDEVAMADVSRNPDLKRIQGEIADALGLNLINVETVRGRADRLRARLECVPKKDILIVLDNLWKKLELKEVGIPCGDDNKLKGCKLLLTSRNRDILRTHMGSDREFQLNMLEHGEARKIFERTVGDRVNNLEFEPWVDGAVKNCGGLPLSIVSLATMLKHKDLGAWRNASTIRDLSSVKSIVELSYNDLKEERIKSLFLICAVTSGRISIRDSLIYGMGLGLFKKFSNTIQDARDRLIVDLQSLQDSSLLLESDDMKWFRMHDIFVDVAISMQDEFMHMKWNALVGKKDYGFKEWLEDELKKCTVISSSYVGIDELPKKLNCPNLRMLLLAEHNSSLKIPESFFESMEKLQVLDLTGLSFTNLPPSIEFLENLKSLSLDDCFLEDVIVLGKLKGLQFLSFNRSTIARLPKEIGELTKLRFLDLTGCFRLKIIEPGMLRSLVNLEELYIDMFGQWEAEGEAPRSNASLVELKNMKKLKTLYIAIPHSTNLSCDLPFGNLNEHKIQIGGIEHWWGEFKESRTLKLKLDSDNLLHEVWMQKCLGRTQDLRLDGSQDGKDSIHNLCTEGFRELKHLHVKNNLSFHYVVDSTRCPAFTRLESLVLKNLSNLEKICCDCLSTESFSKLKIVKVENCGEIKHLFPSSMTRTLLQLEEIEITRCHLMQQIVTDAEADEYIDEIDDDANVKSCKLRWLTLQNLPEMTSFYKTKDHPVVFLDGQKVSLPWLESLTLSELPKLKEIWNSQFPSDVSNLKFLRVEDCAFLLSIFPSNLVIKLLNLEAITVERCQLLRKVFDLEGLTASEDVKILSQLTTLTLSDLPRLGYIWNKNPRLALCFRNLRVLKVQNCENLRFLFSSSMAKALQQIKEIKIASCKLLEDIIDAEEEESEEVASIATLEFPLLTSLSLEELPNLKTFSNGKYRTHFPTLTRLRINGCSRMMTFSSFEGKQQTITADTSLQQAFSGVNSSLSLPILFNQNVLFPSLEELTLVSLCVLMKIWHNQLYEESFCKLASTTVRDCENLSHIFPSTLIERFQSLKMIEVVKCTSLEALMEHVAVNTKKRKKRMVFSNLKEVKLWDLPRLNSFVTSNTKATLSLPSLTNVSLRGCHSLRYLFTNDTFRTLDKLEMLDVSSCNNMHEVVAIEESEERKLKAVKFSHLRTLKLCSLKSLISFSSGNYAYEFPSLRNLSILECTELKAFILRPPEPRVETINDGSAGFDESPHSLFDEKVEFPNMESMTISYMDNVEKIWLDDLASNAFSKLKTLVVEYCEKLSSISSYTMLARFQNLEKITVTECGSLEVVFHVQEFSFSEACSRSTFQLKELVLTRLPKIKNIWSGLPQGGLTFGRLQRMNVTKCDRLKSLFPSSVARSMTQLEKLSVKDCGVEEIIAEEDIVGMNAGDLFFPRLTNLILLELPELRSFYKNSHISTLPLLKELRVRHCANTRLFSLGTTSSESQPALFSFEKVIPQLQRLTLRREDVVMLQHHTFVNLRSLSLSCYHDENVAFPSDFLLHRFPNLEELSVSCNSFDEIFPEDASGHEGASLKALGNLKRLWLIKLCNLRRVWRDGSLMAEILKQIEYMIVLECPSLSILLPSLTSFQRLTELEVRDCAGLVHMGTCSAMTTLVHLTLLILRDCGAMEDVVTDDASGAEEISFPKLLQLTLEGLHSLESFSPTNCAYKFPSLVYIIVKQCPKMNIFCKGALWTPNLDKVRLSYEDDEGRWEGDLNTTIQTLST